MKTGLPIIETTTRRHFDENEPEIPEHIHFIAARIDHRL